MTPDASASWPWPAPYDFVETTRLLRTGANDPCFRREPDGFVRATLTGSGPACVRVRVAAGERILGDAWGPGAGAALRDVPRWLGLDEPPWVLPAHPVTDRLLRRHPGLRLTNTGNVFEALTVTVLQQLVTWQEAAFTWRRLVRNYGEPAPGPGGLYVMPAPAALRRAGVDRLVALGLGVRRAETLIEVAFAASRLQRAAALSTASAAQLLQQVRGVGPWTSAMTLGLYLGRPEPVVYGDVHLPHTVGWALAREPRGDDRRMQALLEPFGGQAFRVIRLLHAARIEAPRRAPKHPIRFGRR